MTWSWEGGRNLDTLRMKIGKMPANLEDAGKTALTQTTDEAAIDLEDKLQAAATPTGEARAARGGFPGRNRSGNMIAQIDSDQEPVETDGIFWSAWGWFAGAFQQYMKDQDLGEGNIPAAHALPDSYVSAKERFRARMLALVGK